jgi:hypothetical protein
MERLLMISSNDFGSRPYLLEIADLYGQFASRPYKSVSKITKSDLKNMIFLNPGSAPLVSHPTFLCENRAFRGWRDSNPRPSLARTLLYHCTSLICLY